MIGRPLLENSISGRGSAGCVVLVDFEAPLSQFSQFVNGSFVEKLSGSAEPTLAVLGGDRAVH